MIHPVRFIFGYRKIRVSSRYAAEILNICMLNGYIYYNFDVDNESGLLTFECGLRTSRKIMRSCGMYGIDAEIVKESGIPSVFMRYRRRYGIFAGIAAFILITVLSGSVLWDIRIEGNRELTDDEVKAQLAICGLTVGSRLSELDTDILENRVMIYSDDIAWISVNIRGTVAQVEIREVQRSDEEEEYDAANLIASCDGQIELFEEVKGNTVVKIGDCVRKGDLLVSGIYDSGTRGCRFVCARGKVLARTQHEYHVEIPLEYQKKVYTGNTSVEKYLIFFEKEIKIFGNYGNRYASCDKIESVEYVDFFSQGELPVGIKTVRYVEYTEQQARRSADAAAELAFWQLRCQMAPLISGAELIRKNSSYEITESAYILDCTALFIENIAVVSRIDIVGDVQRN